VPGELRLIDHDEEMTPAVSDARPHKTSLAVWDIPAPVTLGGSAKLKVGVRCVDGCQLTDQEIEIQDSAQNRIAATRLGAEPWPGTAGLYWAEADVSAPLSQGTHVWTARFSSSDLERAHSASSLAFSLITVKPPEHRVTIEVVQEKTNTVIDGTEVRLGVFRTLTSANGFAFLEVPHGTYELNVWKLGYELVTRNLEITGDLSVRLELVVEPEPSPYV
jgi:hypothetical protein